MPYLSYSKEDKNKPIAILKTADGGSKVLYISDKDSPEKKDDTDKAELNYSEFEKKIQGNKTREKIQMYDIFQKGLSKGTKAEDLLIEDDNIKKIYKDIQEQSGREITVNHSCRFEVMPIVPDEKGGGRDCVYVTGCAGSGKSWFAKHFCENYSKLFKGKRPIYLISQLEEDDTLDSAECKINRIKLDSLVDDPIDLNSGEMKDCLLIFDDWDTIEDTPERKYSSVIWKLLNDCLIIGRHMNISVIVISHYNTGGRKGRLILTECSKYVVYPHGSSAYALKYLLGHHVGIETKYISELGKFGRWICINKTYPKYLVSEHTVKLL